MQALHTIEHETRRVLTTQQLAEAFGTNAKIITRNFQRNQDKYDAGSHYYVLAGEELKAFKGSRQNDDSLKYVSVLYLWTEQGAWMHAKSLNTEQAWEAYRLLIDTYYTLSTRQRLQGTGEPLALPPAVTELITNMESRLIALETHLQQATLHSGEQRRLRNAVGERVYQLSKRSAGARPAIFRAIYSEIRERYCVDSYRDLKQTDLLDALNFIACWGGESLEKRA